jgi:hypothetical protein
MSKNFWSLPSKKIKNIFIYFKNISEYTNDIVLEEKTLSIYWQFFR